MPNAIKPTGFRPVDHLLGLNWSAKIEKMRIPASDTNAYWTGRPVKLAAGGDANGCRNVVTIASGSEATDVPVGVIVGIAPTLQEGYLTFQGTPLALENPPIPATKARDYYVFVVTDPFVIFEAQFDATGTIDATALNKNCSYAVAAGASTTLDYDGTTLTGSTIATTNTLPIKLLGMSHDRAAVSLGANSTFRFIFNVHAYKSASAGV